MPSLTVKEQVSGYLMRLSGFGYAVFGLSGLLFAVLLFRGALRGGSIVFLAGGLGFAVLGIWLMREWVELYRKGELTLQRHTVTISDDGLNINQKALIPWDHCREFDEKRYGDGRNMVYRYFVTHTEPSTGEVMRSEIASYLYFGHNSYAQIRVEVPRRYQLWKDRQTAMTLTPDG